MTFLLTEDQQMLRDTAMSFAADELPVTHLRALRDAGKNGNDTDGRAKLAELGFFGVMIPEAHGGTDFGMVGMGQILEAQGRTIAATPLIETALIGASALMLGGSAEQQAEYLPKIADGSLTTALAIDETSHHAPLNTAMPATKDGDGYNLTGEKRFVANGHYADLFIAPARTSGKAGEAAGITLFLIPADSAGVTITPLKTVDSHGAAHVSFDGCKVSADQTIGGADTGETLLDQILDRARIGMAAEMLGSATAAFELTHEYLQTRKQFGQLIGSFQSLQHRAAKMFTQLELTRSVVADALVAIDENRNDISEIASLAKAMAGETLHLVSNECVQMHGGIGMTDEHDSGLYLKRARVTEALYGSASFHRDRFASLNGF